jgi:hypothetical protein
MPSICVKITISYLSKKKRKIRYFTFFIFTFKNFCIGDYVLIGSGFNCLVKPKLFSFNIKRD